jgi:hemin uptake protein HemP
MQASLDIQAAKSLPSAAAALQARTVNEPSRTVHSEDLLRGGRAVEISHNGSVYRLQATKLGKLILTK